MQEFGEGKIELAWLFKFGENLWMKIDSSNLKSWKGHLANTEKSSTLIGCQN